MMDISLSAQNIVKRYGGVVALVDANLDIHSGEILALVGANGSGKSTLGKVITGVVAPDGGQLLLDGKPVRFSSPHDAQKQGIAAVYQDLSLIPDMSVAENIWLANEPLGVGGLVREREERAKTGDLLELFAGTVSPAFNMDVPVAQLPPDEKQIVEILKAYSRKPRLLILDEATASLDNRQVERLFALVQDWKQAGMALIFISHRMYEIFQIADRVTVLRSGKTVGSDAIHAVTDHDLVQLMIEGGVVREEISRKSRVHVFGAPRLEVRGVQNQQLRGIDFEVREGEILGLGGLRGQGQSNILRAIFGAVPFNGEMVLDGKPLHFSHPRQAMRAGIAFVPGERGAEGLLYIRSILENLQIPSWRRYGLPLRLRQAWEDAGQAARQLGLVMASLDAPVSTLSGGNAQKVVLGKWLLRNPTLLLLDDPTKGVDVGAKGEFYRILNDLRDQGVAIIFYSSDDDELLGLCDRVLVLHDGKIVAELSGMSLTRSALVSASLGAKHEVSQ